MFKTVFGIFFTSIMLVFSCVRLGPSIVSNRDVLYPICRPLQVVRCAPTLGLECRWLRPKVVSTCHDGTGLHNVLRRLVAEPRQPLLGGVQVVHGVCSAVCGVLADHS
jgi:hypothetical protein